MKRTLLLFVFHVVAISVMAQEFDRFFTRQTLRLDYIFS